MADPNPARSERESNVEYHDGETPAVCVGQWCCGCAEHPVGKRWGWNHDAWTIHDLEHHA